jgi:hypothetical protein
MYVHTRIIYGFIVFCGAHNEGTLCEELALCSMELQLHEASGLIPALKKAK